MSNSEFNVFDWVDGYLKAHEYTCGRADEIGSVMWRDGTKYEYPHEGFISREIESVGGEGEGDHRHVIHVIVPAGNYEPVAADGSVPGAVGYFRISGYYCSNDGTTWDDSYESVNPVVYTSFRYQ